MTIMWKSNSNSAHYTAVGHFILYSVHIMQA